MIGNKKTSDELNSHYNHVFKKSQETIHKESPQPTKTSPLTLFIARSEFERNNKMVLSPSIFAEKKSYFKKSLANRKHLKVFEQLLAVVVNSYYSSEYTLNIVFKSTKSNPENKSEENEKLPNGKTKKANGTQKAAKKKVKGRPRNNREKSPEYNESNVLDYLLSPLKKDFVFGEVIRAMDHKGDSHIRVLHLYLRQAFQKNNGVRGLIRSKGRELRTWFCSITSGNSHLTTESGKGKRKR